MELTIRITHDDLSQTHETRTLQDAKTTVMCSGKSVLELINQDIDMWEEGSQRWEEIIAARCLMHYERRNHSGN